MAGEFQALRFGDRMPFGKWKGATVGSVIDRDLDYMVWLDRKKPEMCDRYVKAELSRGSGE